MMSIDLCCEIASGGGPGDFPVFAHPGLLIWAACSMAATRGDSARGVQLCRVQHGATTARGIGRRGLWVCLRANGILTRHTDMRLSSLAFV